jgi:hypothetical protein
MKLLLDTCVWGKAADELRAAGHDVVWAGAWPQDPGDEEILKLAHSEGRVLVALDKDFGELVIVHGRTQRNHPHRGPFGSPAGKCDRARAGPLRQRPPGRCRCHR